MLPWEKHQKHLGRNIVRHQYVLRTMQLKKSSMKKPGRHQAKHEPALSQRKLVALWTSLGKALLACQRR